MSIADQLKKLEKDPAFQQKIKAKRLAAMRNGQPFGKAIDGVSNEGEAKSLAAQVAGEIQAAIDSMFVRTSGVTVHVTAPTVTKNGEYRFLIYFQNVWRESLWPEGHPEGLENIVLLFTKGSKPSKAPIWNTQEIWGWNYKRNRPEKGDYRKGYHVYIPKGSQTSPHPQLLDKVAELNSRLKDQGVTVTLDSIYY